MKLVVNAIPFVLLITEVLASWDEWWTYDGISGPDFWGVLNPKWKMCQWGRRQSPINVDPQKLVFDPHLRNIHIDKHRISGALHNTGQSVIFRVDKDSKRHVNITGGPLVYKYRFEELYVHFGVSESQGSEHHINGNPFPGEIQLYGYNADLYHNMTEARVGSNGIVGLSIMLQVNDRGTDEFRLISSGLSDIMYRGESSAIRHLSVAGLIPDTKHYLTYEGSTTHPGCWETTTWIILNKPMYIATHELKGLRSLWQGDRDLPKAKIADNFRPLRDLNHRTVRTNIDFTNAHRAKGCPSMQKQMFYSAKQWPLL